VKGEEEILLLGSKEKFKANLLILGQGIDVSEIKKLSGETKDKYNFSINQMTLSKDQFDQMSAMGLYPGSKKVIYKHV
jgi:hypothetical protein